MSDAQKRREIFFEFIRVGENLRVCAVDAVTGVEVVTVLPTQTSDHDAQNIALKKLLWRLGQENKVVEEDIDHSERTLGKYL